ncbi:hypothetical protein L1049_012754 [Liquidambar formosana]|uniref:Uncharacterized protein n=1 Tax=Liquidambar formosana TaxID=63359 RepID=A0AAP0RLI2_LIQFO
MPDMVPKQIRLTELNLVAGFYVGSAFIASPLPSSLPLPSFFMKNKVLSKTDDDATMFIASPLPSSLPLPDFFRTNIVLTQTDDDATSDLWRMLQLNGF